MPLDDLLSELYAIDPDLRQHDAALRPLVARIAAAKPDTHFDAAFASRLRAQLLALPAPAMAAPTTSVFSRFFSMPAYRYFVPAGALVAVIAVAVATSVPRSSNDILSRTNGETVALADNAFGSLALSAANPSNPAAGNALAVRNAAESAPSPAPAQGIALDMAAPAVPMAMTDPGMGGGTSAKMVAPDWRPTYYRYTYAGADLPSIDAKMPVLRRVASPLSANADGLAESASGIADLGRLNGLRVQSFNMVQDVPYGFMVYADLNEGTLSLSQNYERWPHPENQCADQACFERYQLKASDVPADDVVIAAADKLLAELGVNRASYGPGMVQPDPGYMTLSARAADAPAEAASRLAYVSESIRVIYPMLVDGKPVHDEGGTPSGITVSVSVREKRADGMYGLESSRYEASNYEMETDPATLRKLAEQGGMYGNYVGTDGEVQAVELGTPELVLTRSWQYDGRSSSQLLVPALRFPVTKAPQNFWQQAVVIPLAKDILERAAGNGGGMIPTPRPLPAAMDAPAATPAVEPRKF
jgi:hypothetical protein